MEIYANIPNFPNYQISNYGNIKNITTNRTLKPANNGKGYLYVNLSNNRKLHKRYIHRLVAEVFVPNINNFPIINHKDENPNNNNSSNLEWCTNEYNLKYGTAQERMKNTMTKKYGKKTLCIETGIIYNSAREAARQNNLIPNNIINCCNGKIKSCGGYHWQYVDAE